MALCILPEDILQHLKCDYCHKYLSVPPIKVCKRKIACGRCLDKTDDEFVDSLFNSLAENFLFNCINCYDGCEKVLTFDLVEKHEQKCYSKEYRCLLCEEDKSKIPTYLFPKHIRNKHRKAFLTENFFRVDLSSQNDNIFFHRKEDYLFFIKTWFDYINNSVLVDTVYLRENNTSTIYQKYSLFQSEQLVRIHKEKCFEVTDIDEKYTVEIKLDDLETHQLVSVMFSFEIPQATKTVHIQPEDKNESNQFGEPTYRSIIKSAISHAMESNKCLWSRRLNLNHDLNNILQKYDISISACQTKLVIDYCDNSEVHKMFICFHCILCKCVMSSFDFDTMYVTKNGTFQHLVCGICSTYVSKFTNLIKLNSVMSLNMYDYVQYSCFKNCENSEYEISLLEHNQKFCKLFINCLQNCFFLADNYLSLREHFKSKHGLKIIAVTDNNFKGFSISNHTKYLLFYNRIIKVSCQLIDKEYCINAEICNKSMINEKIHLIVTVVHDQNKIGTIFNSTMKVDKELNCVDLNFMVI